MLVQAVRQDLYIAPPCARKSDFQRLNPPAILAAGPSLCPSQTSSAAGSGDCRVGTLGDRTRLRAEEEAGEVGAADGEVIEGNGEEVSQADEEQVLDGDGQG